MITELFNSCTY